MNAVDLVRAAARNTLRSRLRTTLTVLALFVGAFTLTLTTAVGAGVSDYVATQVASLGADDVLLVAKTSSSSSSDGAPATYDPATSSALSGTGNPLTGSAGTLSDADVAALRAIPGLRDVQPVSTVAIDWVSGAGDGRFQLAIAPTSSIAQADLVAGAQLDPDSSAPQLILPDSYVGSLGYADAEGAIGATVTLGFTDLLGAAHTRTAEVVGVSRRSLLTSGAGGNAALVDAISTTQHAGSTAPRRYSVAVARFDPSGSTNQIADLKSSISADGMTAQTLADQLGVIQTVILGITGLLNAFAIVALLAAAFGIVNTLLMSVQERTREIGLMKAMGMGGARVFTLFSLEAAFLGLLGSVLGVVVAIAIGIPLSAVLSSGPLSGLEGLQLLIFQPTALAGIVALIVVIAFLAGTLPARRAARKNPIDALRYE